METRMISRGQVLVLCLLSINACGDDDLATGGASSTAQSSASAGGAPTVASGSSTGLTAGPGSTSSSGATSGSGGGGGCAPVSAETCATLEDDDCDGTECSTWSRIDGGAAGSEAIDAVAPAPNGDVYFIAAGDGPFTFGGSSLTGGVGLAKASSTGDDLWLRELPAASNASALLLAHASTGPVVTFGFVGTVNLGGADLVADGAGPFDMAIASFDADGGHRWSRAFSSPAYFNLIKVADTPSGDLLYLGGADAPITSNGATVIDAPGRILVLVSPSDGAILWARTLVEWHLDDTIVQTSNLAVAQDGQILIGGHYNGTPDLGNGPIPEGNDSVFLARLSPSGIPVESVRLCEGTCSLTGFAPGRDGELYLSGFTMGVTTLGGAILSGTNTYLARFDSLTQAAWIKSYLFVGDSGLGAPILAVQADGTLVFAHTFHGSVSLGFGQLVSQGQVDLAVGKLTPDGTALWHRGFGGPNGFPQALFFGIQPTGESTLAFKLREGSMGFGSGQLDAIGGAGDMVLVRLAP